MGGSAFSCSIAFSLLAANVKVKPHTDKEEISVTSVIRTRFTLSALLHFGFVKCDHHNYCNNLRKKYDIEI